MNACGRGVGNPMMAVIKQSETMSPAGDTSFILSSALCTVLELIELYTEYCVRNDETSVCQQTLPNCILHYKIIMSWA